MKGKIYKNKLSNNQQQSKPIKRQIVRGSFDHQIHSLLIDDDPENNDFVVGIRNNHNTNNDQVQSQIDSGLREAMAQPQFCQANSGEFLIGKSSNVVRYKQHHNQQNQLNSVSATSAMTKGGFHIVSNKSNKRMTKKQHFLPFSGSKSNIKANNNKLFQLPKHTDKTIKSTITDEKSSRQLRRVVSNPNLKDISSVSAVFHQKSQNNRGNSDPQEQEYQQNTLQFFQSGVGSPRGGGKLFQMKNQKHFADNSIKAKSNIYSQLQPQNSSNNNCFLGQGQNDNTSYLFYKNNNKSAIAVYPTSHNHVQGYVSPNNNSPKYQYQYQQHLQRQLLGTTPLSHPTQLENKENNGKMSTINPSTQKRFKQRIQCLQRQSSLQAEHYQSQLLQKDKLISEMKTALKQKEDIIKRLMDQNSNLSSRSYLSGGINHQ